MSGGWTDKEEEILRELYPDRNVSYEEMEDQLGRTESAIRGKASRLGLTRPNPREWTDDEEDTLRQMYGEPGTTLEDIANATGRTVAGVSHKAENIGIRNERNHWTEEEDQHLQEMKENGEDAETIANKLGRTTQAVHHRAHRLGLSHTQSETRASHIDEATPEQLAYLAGLFDGEGSIGIYQKEETVDGEKYTTSLPQLRIGMTCDTTIRRAHQFIGGALNHTEEEKDDHRRTVHRIQSASAQVVKTFLEAVRPYLITKKEEANLAIEGCEILIEHGRGGVRTEEKKRRRLKGISEKLISLK